MTYDEETELRLRLEAEQEEKAASRHESIGFLIGWMAGFGVASCLAYSEPGWLGAGFFVGVGVFVVWRWMSD